MNDCDAIIFDFIDGKKLADCALPEADIVRIGRQLQHEIQALGPDLPVYIDIGSAEKWRAFTQATLTRLSQLIQDGIFSHTEMSLVQILREWAEDPHLVRLIAQESTFIHGDLKGDNIFLTADGYRLIDWQRPLYAPPDVDLVTLLLGTGFDPGTHVSRAVIEIFYFLQIDWFTRCKATLFPQGEVYEAAVAHAAQVLLAAIQPEQVDDTPCHGSRRLN